MAKKKVKKLQIFIDPIGNTMHLWWGDRSRAHHSEEAAEGFDVIVFDHKNVPIGFEKLGVFPKEVDPIKRLLIPSTSLLVAR